MKKILLILFLGVSFISYSQTVVQADTLTARSRLKLSGVRANGISTDSTQSLKRTDYLITEWASKRYADALLSGVGGVTSVGITGGSGIGVSNSPITTSGNITLSLGNITPSTVVSSGAITGTTLSGTIVTSLQPNITLVGTLSNLTVSGTVNSNYLKSNSLSKSARTDINQVFVGDSRFTTYSGQTSIPTYLMTKSNFYGQGTAYNLAVGGSVIADLYSSYTADVYPKRPTGGITEANLHVMIGINNIQHTWNPNPYAIADSILQYCAMAKGHGFTVTLYSSFYEHDLTARQEIARRKMNDSLRAGAGSYYFFVDLENIFVAQSDDPFYLDVTHLKSIGNELIANYVNDKFPLGNTGNTIINRNQGQDVFTPYDSIWIKGKLAVDDTTKTRDLIASRSVVAHSMYNYGNYLTEGRFQFGAVTSPSNFGQFGVADTYGMYWTPWVGGTYDYFWMNAALDNYVMAVPTGTSDVIIGGSLSVTGTLAAGLTSETTSTLTFYNPSTKLFTYGPSSAITTNYLTPFSGTSLTTTSPYTNLSVTGSVYGGSFSTVGSVFARGDIGVTNTTGASNLLYARSATSYTGIGGDGMGVAPLNSDKVYTNIGQQTSYRTLNIYTATGNAVGIDTNTISFFQPTSGTRSLRLQSASITDGFNRTQTFQNASGTIALTSDIANYLTRSSTTITTATLGDNFTTTGNIQSSNITATGQVTAATISISGNSIFNDIGLGGAPQSGGGAGRWIFANGSSYSGGLIHGVNDVAKSYYYYDGSYVQTLAASGIPIQFSPNGAAALTLNAAGGNNITFNAYGTGSLQVTSGVVSVISDSRLKTITGKLNGSAISALMKIPIPQYWKYNKKSKMPLSAQKVSQFGLLADKVYDALGEEFAPTQKDGYHSLSDRALLSLTIQALQEKKKQDDARFESQQNQINELKAAIKALQKK